MGGCGESHNLNFEYKKKRKKKKKKEKKKKKNGACGPSFPCHGASNAEEALARPDGGEREIESRFFRAESPGKSRWRGGKSAKGRVQEKARKEGGACWRRTRCIKGRAWKNVYPQHVLSCNS